MILIYENDHLTSRKHHRSHKPQSKINPKRFLVTLFEVRRTNFWATLDKFTFLNHAIFGKLLQSFFGDRDVVMKNESTTSKENLKF